MAAPARHHMVDGYDETTPLTINAAEFQGTSTDPCYSSVVSSECVPQQDEDICPVRNEPSSSLTDSIDLYGHRRDVHTEYARNIIDSTIKSFSSALGLLVCIFCNHENCPGEKTKVITHRGSELMEEAFKYLGYATCSFPNPSCELFADICIMLANDTTFPPSYKRLFLYICTHGSDEYFQTADDSFIEISNVVTKFMPASSDLNLPRILMCDVCRGEIDGNVDPVRVLPIPLYSRQNPDEIFGNTMTFFSTSKSFKAYAFPDGSPIISEILHDLLMKPVKRNLFSILTIDVKDCLDAKAKTYPELKHVYPDCQSYLKEEIDLYDERLVPMTATGVTIAKGYLMSRASWTAPKHANEQRLKNYNLVIQQLKSTWEFKKKVSKNKTSTTVPTSLLEDAQVIIEANYQDYTNTTASTKPEPANIRNNRPLKALVFVTSVFCAILLALLGLYIGLVSSTIENLNMLGITGDAMECATPNCLRMLSDINVKEEAKFDDNPNGFQMDVFELSSDDIKKKFRIHVDKNEDKKQEFDSSGSQTFIIPHDYYSRPWYMWYGSSITISYNLNYSHKPSDAVLYLIRGDEDINNFVSGSTFHHEKKDFLLHDSGQIHWEVRNNGYYFVAVHINAEEGTIFNFNITFALKYINPDDFSSWIRESAKLVGGVGSTATLKHSITSLNSNHTLCYLHLTESPGSSRIHLDVSFTTELITWIIPALILVIICLLYFLLLFIFCCKCKLRLFQVVQQYLLRF